MVTDPVAPSEERRPLAALIALAVLLGTVAWGIDGLDRWIQVGTTLGAQGWGDRWIVGALASGGLLLALALVRRDPLAAAGAILAWGLSLAAVLDLPPFPFNDRYPDTPGAIPLYLGLGGLGGLWALFGPRRVTSAERLLLLALFATTSSGKLFGRGEANATFALLTALVSLALLGLPVRQPATEDRAPARAADLLGLALVLWVFTAGWLGDSWSSGWRVALRVLLGAGLALAMSRGLDRAGAVRAVWALFLGWLMCFAILGVGLGEAAVQETWDRVSNTRLRLLGMHANGIGTLFAMGLAGGLVLSSAPRNGRLGLPGRGLGVLMTLGCALALWRTESAASQVGGALGALVALSLPRMPLPRRTVPIGIALGALGAIGVGFWFSPASASLRSSLDALTQGPSALGQRWHFWRMSLAAANDSPWFGVGPNQYYVHSQFAESSYYDGTPQSLHSHNLWLGWAEGAGWPFAILATLLCLAVMAWAVRRARNSEASEVPTDRRLASFFAATTVALLAANSLDLGQSQSTFIPLWLWIALGGLLASGTCDTSASPAAPAAPGSRVPGTVIALLLMLAGWLHPLAVDSQLARGTGLQDSGRLESAMPYLVRAQQLSPRDSTILAQVSRAAQVLGDKHPLGSQTMRLTKETCDLSPSRVTHWRRRAKVCLGQGKWTAAKKAINRGIECDPYGVERAELDALRVWWHFTQNDRLGAGAALLECVQHQGRPWEILGTRTRKDSDPTAPEGARTVWLVSPGKNLPFDRDGYALRDLIDTLAQLAIETLAEDLVASRRYLRSAVEGYLFEGRPDLGIALLERHEELRGVPMTALYNLRLTCLNALGDQEAYDSVALENIDTWNETTTLKYLVGRYAGGEQRTPQDWWSAIEPLLYAHDGRDIFFEANEHADWLANLAALLRDIGRDREALHWLQRSLRDTPTVSRRAERTVEFYRGCVSQNVSQELLLGSFALVAEELGRARRGVALPEDWHALGRELYEALGSPGSEAVPLAVRHLQGSGYAARLALAELKRLAAPQ